MEIGKTYTEQEVQALLAEQSKKPTFQQASSYQDAQKKRQSGTLGPVYLPTQFDNAWTHVAEEIGQNGTGEKALSTRALYPGDISNRFEIMVTVAKKIKLDVDTSKNEKTGLEDDTPRWRKLHMGQASVGIKGRLPDGTLVELRQRDGKDGQTPLTNSEGQYIRYWHPVTPPPKPGEIIELGVLTDDNGKRLSAPGTGGFFTARKNTDTGKVFLARDLDTWVVDGKKWICQGGLPVDPKELTPEWARMSDVNGNEERIKFFEGRARRAKKDIDLKDPSVKSEIQRLADEFFAKKDDENYVKSLISFGQDVSANWFQKYKYACYFQPNTETRVNPINGEIEDCKFGDLVVAYDWDSRQIWRRHNSGKATQETGRNIGYNPPLLYKKTHFYLQHQTVSDWMLEHSAWAIDTTGDPNKKNVDELYDKSRRILEFIIHTRIGEGSLSADGAPRQAGALALTRINGNTYDSAKMLCKLTTTSLASGIGGGILTAVGAGFIISGTLAASLTLPAVALGSLGALYSFKVGSETFASYRNTMVHPYEEAFNTKIFKSRNADAGSFAWKAYRDELSFFVENMRGLIFTYFENDNNISFWDAIGKTGYYVAGALVAGSAFAFGGAISASLAAPLALVAVTCAGTAASIRQICHMARQGEEKFIDIVFDEALKAVENDRPMSKDVNDHYMRPSLESILQRPPVRKFKKERVEKAKIEKAAEQAKENGDITKADAPNLGAVRNQAKGAPAMAV